MLNKQQAKRYNTGKVKYNLLPDFAMEQFAKVMTMGAEKYGDRNWEKGMPWSMMIASMKRHIAAYEAGEDLDPESGLLHMAHVMTNAAFLLEYYKIHSKGDDRTTKYPYYKKVGLDIDQVLCDFVGGIYEYLNEPLTEVLFWNDPVLCKGFNMVKEDKEFWLNLKPLISPKDLKFEPVCYITSRDIPTEISETWLINNGFPSVPVESVGNNNSKVDIALKYELDIFVDDHIKNFVELNQAGINCFLLNTTYNSKYDVGYKRVYELNEILLK